MTFWFHKGKFSKDNFLFSENILSYSLVINIFYLYSLILLILIVFHGIKIKKIL
jgi:hypothetical protein